MITGTLDPVSNRATWTEQYQLIDRDTNAGIDLSTITAADVAVRNIDTGELVLSGSLADGTITQLATTGTLQWSFSTSLMQNLCAGVYDVGLRLTQSDGTDVALIIGQVPVMDGVV